MADTTRKWSDGMEYVKRKELEELKERLHQLEERLAVLEQGQPPTT